ncbi:hypothetical protein A3F08_02795 [Candidatus Berkelbacteria bacterium RIFCSPHIGHO2_12_FULL_36_9]|uniref:HD domain-containing protein n=1 Tax=Candidatus Berkelbacteria bacterium RIFCSPHIGHO2_12_FULL_36_9 TaxID=1797469 RepID=A0A1F5EE58_9BACT|nr:MAG: hypothetical protein A3F08_02795 [Candidatus Berkelbacteria bacterium RIFCSPHIGHO2_12_FULL_36_9]
MPEELSPVPKEAMQFDLKKKKEWTKSVSEHEYFESLGSSEDEIKSKLESFTNLNDYLRFFKKLESPDGRKFSRTLGTEAFERLKQSSLENIVELISSGYEEKVKEKSKGGYRRTWGRDEREYYHPGEERERVSFQTIDQVVNAVGNSTILSFDEKSLMIKELVTKLPLYLIEMPGYAQKPGYYPRGVSEEEPIHSEKVEAHIFKKIHEGLIEPTVVENLAQQFIDSFEKGKLNFTDLVMRDRLTQKDFNPYLFDFLLGSRTLREYLISNTEEIKSNTVSQFAEMFSKETTEEERINRRRHIHSAFEQFDRALKYFVDEETKTQLAEIAKKSADEIFEQVDRFLLEKNEYFAKSVIKSNLLQEEEPKEGESPALNSDQRFLKKLEEHLDRKQITSEKLKGQIIEFAQFVRSAEQFFKKINAPIIYPNVIKDWFNFENFQKIYSQENPREVMDKFLNNPEVFVCMQTVNRSLKYEAFVDFDCVIGNIQALREEGFRRVFLERASHDLHSYNTEQVIADILSVAEKLQLNQETIKNIAQKVIITLIENGEISNFEEVWNQRKRFTVEDDFLQSEETKNAYILGLSKNLVKGNIYGIEQFMKIQSMFELSDQDLVRDDLSEAYRKGLKAAVMESQRQEPVSNSDNLRQVSWYLELSNKFGASSDSIMESEGLKEALDTFTYLFVSGYMAKEGELEGVVEIFSKNPEYFKAYGVDIEKFYENFKDYDKLEKITSYGDKTLRIKILCMILTSPDPEKKIEMLYQYDEKIKELLSPQSPLFNYADKIIASILSSSEPEEEINRYSSIFLNGLSKFYQKCAKIVQVNLGAALAEGHSDADVTPALLEIYGPGKIPEDTTFSALSADDKLKVLENILKRSEVLSQHYGYIADERNREWIGSFYHGGVVDASQEINVLRDAGTMVHGTQLADLSAILRNGNIAGECILQKSKLDHAPFHVDFTEVTQKEMHYQQRDSLRSMSGAGYGDGLVLIYQTRDNQIEDIEGKELEKEGLIDQVYSYNLGRWPEKSSRPDLARVGGGRHSGILGAIPSIEISAIIVNKEKVVSEKRDYSDYISNTKMQIVENGFYIPVLDADGHLLFTPEEFDEETKKYKIYETVNAAVKDPDFYKKVLAEKYNPDFVKLLQSLPTMEGQGGVHRFTREAHMEKAVAYIDEINKKGYDLEGKQVVLMKLAAKLHDIGKVAGGVQFLDNTTVAQEIIRKSIKGVTESDLRLILLLIREDELLGNLLMSTNLDAKGKVVSTNIELKDKFLKLFQSVDPDLSEAENNHWSEMYRKMMICLYKADVMAIDDGEIYKKDKWAVDEKLKALELDFV